MHERQPDLEGDEEAGELLEENDDGGEVLEVHIVPLHQPLGKYADDFVIEIVPPDVVFTPPPKPAPPLPAQTQLPSLTKHGDAFGPSSRLNSSVLLIGAVGLAACTMLWLEYRGAVARRGAFYLTMERLAESLKPSLWHPDPASGQHAGVRACDGTLKERMDEAARRVSVLQLLLKDASEASRRCPWDPRGKHPRELKDVCRTLRERHAKMERAVEELKVMLEVTLLLERLDNVDGASLQQDGDSDAEDYDSDSDETVISGRGSFDSTGNSNSSASGDGATTSGSRLGNSTAGSAERQRRPAPTKGRTVEGGTGGGTSGLLGAAGPTIYRRRYRDGSNTPFSPKRATSGGPEDAGGDSLGDGGSRRGRRKRKKQERSTRMLTRVNALLAAGKMSKDRRRAQRCVFRLELEECCQALAQREQNTVDRLKAGLRKWDLRMVDRALAELRALELWELAESFEDKREDVRSKRLGLVEELRDAQRSVGREAASQLREACVKAETFSCTDLPEYKTAKRSLENSRAMELETQARRILASHGVVPNPSFNVLFDPMRGPTLVLKGCHDGVSGDYGERPKKPRLEQIAAANEHGASVAGENGYNHSDSKNGGDCGVNRRLPLGGLQQVVYEGADRIAASGDGDGIRRVYDVGHSDADGDGSGADDGEMGERGGRSDLVSDPLAQSHQTGQPWVVGGTGAQGGTIQHHSEEQQPLRMSVRRNVAAEFLSYVTRREEENRRACDADRKALQKREEKAIYHREYIAQLDARKEQEDKRLKIEEKRRREKEEERQQQRKEHERILDENRLSRLWSADKDFFNYLALFDLALAAAMVAWRKGFSLAPRAVVDALWGLIVAECRKEFNSADRDMETAFPMSSLPPTSAIAARSAAFGADAPSSGITTQYDSLSRVATSCLQQQSGCAAEGGVEWGGTGDLGVGTHGGVAAGGSAAGNALWWAGSAVVSAAGSVVHTSFSTLGWICGQTLSTVNPDVKCEIRAVLLATFWLLTLWLALRMVTSLSGDSGGPVATVVRLLLLASWIWGRFSALVMEATHKLLLPMVVAPVLVLAYGPLLKYFEGHRRPGGFWWWREWDVRFFLSRVMPVLVSGFVAGLLGLEAGCSRAAEEVAGGRSEWWCSS